MALSSASLRTRSRSPARSHLRPLHFPSDPLPSRYNSPKRARTLSPAPLLPPTTHPLRSPVQYGDLAPSASPSPPPHPAQRTRLAPSPLFAQALGRATGGARSAGMPPQMLSERAARREEGQRGREGGSPRGQGAPSRATKRWAEEQARMEYNGQWSPTSTKNGSHEEEDEREEGEVDEAAWDDYKVRAQARDALEMSVEEYEDKWGRGAARDGSSPPALTSTLRFGRPRVKDLPDWKHAHLPPGPPVAFTLHARIFPPAAPHIVPSKCYCDAARSPSPPRSPPEPTTKQDRSYHPSARLSSFRFMRPKPATTAAARFTCGFSGDAVIELSPSPSPTPPPMPVEEQIWLERECERDDGIELEEGEVLMQDVMTLVDSENTPLSLRGGAASLPSATNSQSSRLGHGPPKPTSSTSRAVPAGTSSANGDGGFPMRDDPDPASPAASSASPSSRRPFTRSAFLPPRSSSPPSARSASPPPQAQHRATHRVHPTRERSPYAYEGEHDEDPWAEREREIQQEENREVAEVLRRKRRRDAEVAVERGEVEVLDLTGDESDEE